MNQEIFAHNKAEIGRKNQPINPFKAGGRVSPTASATTFDVGTIRTSDNDGNEWIIKADKNGKQSWKRYKEQSETPKIKGNKEWFDFVISQKSYFDTDNDDDEYDFINFKTRDSGSVGDETYGEEDYQEAVEIKNRILKEYPDTEIEIDTIDEWVSLSIQYIAPTLKPEPWASVGTQIVNKITGDQGKILSVKWSADVWLYKIQFTSSEEVFVGLWEEKQLKESWSKLKSKIPPPLAVPKSLIDDAYFLIGLQKQRINKQPIQFDINLIKSSFVNKVKALKRNGEQNMVNALLNWFEKVEADQLTKPVFTKNNAIWKLRDSVPLKEPEKKVDNELITELNETISDLNWIYSLPEQDLDSRVDVRNEVGVLSGMRTTELGKEFDIKNQMNRYFSLSVVPLALIQDEAPRVAKNLINSKSFIDWFGNWKDEKSLHSSVMFGGKPLIVYHGTKVANPFSRFDMSKFPVMYFAENYEYAKWFADLGSGVLYPTYLDIKYLFDLSDLGYRPVPWVKIVSSAADQGVILPTKHPKYPVMAKMPAWGWLRGDTPNNILTEAVRLAGYTGMKHVENNPNDKDKNGNQRTTNAYMIFNPNQAKVVVDGSQFENISDVLYLNKGGSIKERLKRLKK